MPLIVQNERSKITSQIDLTLTPSRRHQPPCCNKEVRLTLFYNTRTNLAKDSQELPTPPTLLWINYYFLFKFWYLEVH